MTQRSEQSTPTAFPGDVLVAACGFIVTGAAWALFGFLEDELTASSTAAVFYALALMHFLVGIVIFTRRPIAVPTGVLIALAGLIFAALTPQFVLIFTNSVILLLLLLARASVSARQKLA